MKTTSLTQRLLKRSALFLVVSGVHFTAIAQNAPPGAPGNAPPATQAWSQHDANQNGRLDKEEREAARRDYIEQRKERRRVRAQAAAEARRATLAAKYARQKISPLLLEKYDRNQHGRLDPHEWERHRQDLKKLMAEQGQRASPTPTPPAAPGP
ncbi:MAG: hypothetical protein HYY24_17085 [Verrucomicrobia bacterium]|nr:hypothetical protein [Verrucomicrobiota bacterium]